MFTQVKFRDVNQLGFTLIELLVVLSIVSLLSSVVFAAVGGARKKGRDARRQEDLHTIQVAIESYLDNNSLVPVTPTTTKLSDISGLGTSSLPRDPFTNQSYKYIATKLIGGDNIICTSIPCTGYEVVSNIESPRTADAIYVVKDGVGNVISSSTIANTVAMDVALTPAGATTTATTTVTDLAAVAWSAVPTPGPVQEAWSSVAYGNGLYAAVGGMGTPNAVMTSPDGVSWTSRSTPKGWQWTSIAYGASTFVAVSDYDRVNSTWGSSKIMISSDGINWTLRDTGIARQWTSIIWTGSMFVAVAKDTTVDLTVMTSPDGITWTGHPDAVNSAKYGVTFGVGLIVAVGDGTIYTSGDGGVNWAQRPAPLDLGGYSTTFTNITYASGTFIATSIDYSDYDDNVITSTDTITWTRRTVPFHEAAGQITYDGTAFVIANSYNTTFARSTNGGNTWSAVPVPQSADAMVYANGKYVTIRTWGDSSAVMTSLNGTSWSVRSTPSYENWTAVAYGGGKFVAVSSSGRNTGVMTSSDGYNWTMRTTPLAHAWSAVGYGNGQFVITSSDSSTSSVETSPDGVNWTTRTTPAGISWWGAAYGSGTWVATGVNYVLTSSDAITWTQRAAPSNWWGPIIFANGKFVSAAIRTASNAYMTSNGVMTSPDGITWTVPTAPAVPEATGVAFGNGKYVIVGGTSGYLTGEQTTMTSSDAITWTLQGNPNESRNGVAFGVNNFAAVSYAGNPGYTDMSPNGASWTQSIIQPVNAHAVAYGNGVFVGVNGEGVGTDVIVANAP